MDEQASLVIELESAKIQSIGLSVSHLPSQRATLGAPVKPPGQAFCPEGSWPGPGVKFPANCSSFLPWIGLARDRHQCDRPNGFPAVGPSSDAPAQFPFNNGRAKRSGHRHNVDAHATSADAQLDGGRDSAGWA